MDNPARVTQLAFPTAPGLLLGASLALHLAAVAELLFGLKQTAAAFFIIGQFLVALALLRLYDGKWVFQDIRLFFAIFLFLYGGTLPLVILFGLGGHERGLPGAVFMYGTAFLGFNLVQWWYRQPWRDVPKEAFARIRPTRLNLGLLLLAFALVGAYAAARGVGISFTIDRSQVGLLGTQLWVVAMFVVNGLVMYMIAGWSNLSRLERIAVVLSATGFILFQLAMGNRRDFLPMLVFVAGVIATRRRSVIRLAGVVLGFIAFVIFTAIGIVRQIFQDPGVLTRFNPVELLVTQNEFVSPIFTLVHYINVFRPLRFGFTYLYAPALFVPRAVWPDKPESLSLQFMRDAFGTTDLMGFAYTPVTEAFINFWYVGPFVVFALLSILMVKLVRNASVYPGLYFIAFALVVDFNRGDFGGMFYTTTVVAGAYALMSFVSRLRWLPRTIEGTVQGGARSRAEPAIVPHG